MPGIVALITKMPRERAMSQLTHMVDVLCHESFYSTATWVDESSGVFVGLVSREDSARDTLPLHNQPDDVKLAFSGEEFSNSRDGEVSSYLVRNYEKDPSFPAGLNGRFHGLLHDQNRRTTLLFNDRYGMHRLYCHESRDGFYFAAEAKAILAVCPETRELDSRGVGEFVACGAVLENRTLFKGIEVMPPGSAWVFRNARPERKASYFRPEEWEQQEKLDTESYYRELREVFVRNLPRYFQGNQRIGMSLTGGLDSRMILANQRRASGSLPCYTFGSMFRENQDVRIAKQVAEACGQTHQVITAGKDFLAQFPRYAERAVYLSDGCVDVSRSPDLYLNEIVREIAPVRMAGTYGGEVLRGVRAFKAEEPAAGLFSPEFSCVINEAKETCNAIVGGHPVSFAVFKLSPWYLYGVLGLEETQLSIRAPFLDNDFIRTVFRARDSAMTSSDVSLRLIGDGNPNLLRIPTDRGLSGNQGRALGTASHLLQNFLFKAEYAYDIGMPQWLARFDHALRPLHLERAFLGRHKPFHFRVWYRDELAGYLQDVLLQPCALSRSYINPRKLHATVLGHVNGKYNYTNAIHKVLSLELLQHVFNPNALKSPQRNRWAVHGPVSAS